MHRRSGNGGEARTTSLVYTVIVAYGLFRYMFKTQEGKGGSGPSEILVRDWVFPALGALWIASVAFILCFAVNPDGVRPSSGASITWR